LLLVHLFLIFSDMGKKLRKVIHKKEHRENWRSRGISIQHYLENFKVENRIELVIQSSASQTLMCVCISRWKCSDENSDSADLVPSEILHVYQAFRECPSDNLWAKLWLASIDYSHVHWWKWDSSRQVKYNLCHCIHKIPRIMQAFNTHLFNNVLPIMVSYFQILEVFVCLHALRYLH
jgi:hypothetical protein